MADRRKLRALFRCYESQDEVVRLRTSNALKRVTRAQPTWVAPYLDHLLDDITQIDQASARWTLAQLFAALEAYLSVQQKEKAKAVLKPNLASSDDWIVVIKSLETLSAWAEEDAPLRTWLRPQLERRSRDPRKAVAGKAKKLYKTLFLPKGLDLSDP